MKQKQQLGEWSLERDEYEQIGIKAKCSTVCSRYIIVV